MSHHGMRAAAAQQLGGEKTLRASYGSYLSSDTSVSSFTLPAPPNAASGDLMYMLICWDNAVNSWVTGPADYGWTLVDELLSGTNPCYALYRKVCGASEASSYALETDSSKKTSAFTVAIANATHDAAGTGSKVTNGMPVAPSITVANSDSWLLYFAVEKNAGTFTPPTGYTEYIDITDTNRGNITMAYKTGVASGSSGTATGTDTAANGAFAFHVSIY